jgi:hypothetical protein
MTSRHHEKSPTVERKHRALQNQTRNFFFFWGGGAILAFLDPDPECGSIFVYVDHDFSSYRAKGQALDLNTLCTLLEDKKPFRLKYRSLKRQF